MNASISPHVKGTTGTTLVLRHPGPNSRKQVSCVPDDERRPLLLQRMLHGPPSLH